MASSVQAPRTQLFADPEGKFLHDVVLDSCRRHRCQDRDRRCVVHPPRQRITYAAYGEMVEMAARGMVAADIKPGEQIGIFLPNCWEFGVAFHAAMLAGAVPTTLNPDLSRARSPLPTGNLRRGCAHHRRLAADRNRPQRAAGSAQGIHDSHARPERLGAVRFAFRSHRRHPAADAGASSAADTGDASLLQRHDRPAQRRDADALQPGGECLSDADSRRVRRHRPTTMSCCAFCRCITSTD